jgi:hypothetical protein
MTTLMTGKNGAIYIAWYDLSGYANKFNLKLPRGFEDVTVFQAGGGHLWAPTLHNNSLEFDAFFDQLDTDGLHSVLNSLRTVTGGIVASVCFDITQGAPAVVGHGAFEDDYPIEVPIEGIIKAKGAFKFTDFAPSGYLLQPKATKTANGNGTGVDDLAASTNGAEACLHMFACGGAAAAIIKVQTDDNSGFTTPTDLITFTTLNAAWSERKAVTGAVERYVRVTWAGTGTYSISFAVTWCRL